MFDIEKFARLARIKLTPKESEKIGKDLRDILNHFKELETLDTKKVEPMTGGTGLLNIFRNDDESEDHRVSGGADQFPGEKNGYLKGPKIFE